MEKSHTAAAVIDKHLLKGKKNLQTIKQIILNRDTDNNIYI